MSRFLLILMLLLAVSATAADFKLPSQGKDLSGETVELKEGTRGTVLVFLSAHCPCSNSHIELLKKMARENEGFKFYAIHANADESLEESRKYFAGKNLPFPVLDDRTQSLANELHANKTPHAFVFDRDGKILFRGGVTDSHNALEAKHQYLADALKNIERGEKVGTPEARTLGCVISRASM